MKNNLLPLILIQLAFFFTVWSCKQQSSDIDYIKVIAFTDADTVTLYNKGIGLHTFAYYEPGNDSIIYAHKINSDTAKYETFTFDLKETTYRDSFLNVMKALQKYGTGNTLDTAFHYCVDPIYLEYKTNNKTSYHYFVERDDTIDIFTNLFFSLASRPIVKQNVGTNTVNFQSEAVNAMKMIGEYDKIEEPYIPASCNDGIDKRKIYGSWRSVYEGFNSRNTFKKVTFNKNGTYFFEDIDKGVVYKRTKMLEFDMPDGDDLFVVKTKGQEAKLPILKLTDSCLIIKRRNDSLMYNRLSFK